MSMPIPLSSEHGRDIWRKTILGDIEYAKSNDEACNNYFCNHARQLLLESLNVLDNMQIRAEKAEAAFNKHVLCKENKESE